MPEDELVSNSIGCSNIYKLISEDTINKFRGLKGVRLNKFDLSKYIGQYLKMSTLIDNKEKSRKIIL